VSLQATHKAAVRFHEHSNCSITCWRSLPRLATLDLDQILANGRRSSIIDCELFAILLFSEKRHDLRIRCASGHREEVVRNLSLALVRITGRRLQREPILKMCARIRTI
jgi:hypothetical protein